MTSNLGSCILRNNGIVELEKATSSYNSISLQEAILHCVTGFQWYLSVLNTNMHTVLKV